MKRWAVVAVAACGAKAAEQGPASGSSRAPIAISVDAGVAPPPAPPSYRIEAPPGGTIVQLAVTPTADAALTVDDAGEVRLWPTLDGKHPPIAVELPPATALALHKSGNEFVALLGLIGGAVVVRIDGDGKRLSVVELAAIDGAAALDTGFVTWRGKHLEWVDVAGKVTRTSDTEPRPVVPASKVTAKGSDLVVGGRYLGYAFPLQHLPTGRDPNHLILSGPPDRFLQLTADLTVVGELAPTAPGATALTWLGDHDWLVDTPAGVVLWTEGAAGTLVAPKFEVAQVEPSSHLVMLHEIQKPGATTNPVRQLLRHHDHKLDPIAFTAWDTRPFSADLIPPATNRGALIVLQEFERDPKGVEHGHARWIHDLDHPAQGMKSWDGDLAWPLDVTGSGALIINHQAKKWSLVIDGDFQYDLDANIALSDDGTRALRRATGGMIELYKRGGSTIWSIPMPGRDAPYLSTPLWRGDRIWLLQPRGVALLDPATGAIKRAPTGWGFELSSTPHPISTLRRPLAVAAATNRDAPLALAGDAKFQQLVRDVVAASSTHIMWWGPVKLDGLARRVAFLQSPDINGSPLYAYLVEVAPDAVVAITIQMWGFPRFQGPFLNADPVWGTIKSDEDNTTAPTLSAELSVHSQWIHGSFEDITFTLDKGDFVAVSDTWLERENTGSNVPGKRYESTEAAKVFPAGRRPKLATFKGHTAKFAISAKSNSAADLAAGIHELPHDP